MERVSNTGEALDQVEGGCVEELVGNAEDAACAHGAQVLPVALYDHAVKGDAISGSAPGEEDNIRIGQGDCIGSGLRARLADKASVGCCDQFGDPGLRGNERLPPLFAVNGLRLKRGADVGCLQDEGLELFDECFSKGKGVYLAGDKPGVKVDVSKGVWRQRKHGDPRL